MTRSLVALAIATRIPFAAWADEDNRVIETAWDLIEERDGGRRSASPDRVMGG